MIDKAYEKNCERRAHSSFFMAAAVLMAEDGAGRLYFRKQECSGASRRPGSMVRALRAKPWAFPTERAGSEGREKVLKIDGAFAPRVLRFDSPFGAEGCGGGWRRKYLHCLSAAVVDAFKNERRHDDKTEESSCGRSPVVWFFIPRSGITKLIARRAIPQPSAPQAPSTLRTLRTFGPEGRRPSRRRRVQMPPP